MRSRFQSTQQLVWMRNVLLNQGVTCVYLSATVKESRYHMDLMNWLFRFENFNRDQYWIRYPKASLYFKSASSPPHTLHGYKARIIADHNAFKAGNPDRVEFQDLIYQSRRYEHLEDN